MKAMWTAFVAIAAIAAVVGLILGGIDYSSTERYSTDNVRVD